MKHLLSDVSVVSRGSELYDYSLHGLRVISNTSLPLVSTSNQDCFGEIRFVYIPGLIEPADRVLYMSPPDNESGSHFVVLYQKNNGYNLCFPGVADFSMQGNLITAHPASNVPVDVLVDYFLAYVVSFWLELRGVRVLHASVIEVDGAAVGFLADSGLGKSTCAAEFLKNGYSMFSDDALAIQAGGSQFWGLPGYPRLRLWSEHGNLREDQFLSEYESANGKSIGDSYACEGILINNSKCKRSWTIGMGNTGNFCNRTLPIAKLYVLNRGALTTEIQKISPRDAVIELVRFSCLKRLTAAVGLQSERLLFFTQLAQQVPVGQLNYPNGMEFLPDVREIIVRDLKQPRVVFQPI